MALELQFHLDIGEPLDAASSALAPGHPAVGAFVAAGGTGPLFAETKIAPGKGLGYSGAARVAGIAAASLQRGGFIDYPRLLANATALEGHPDNAAASIYGGITVAAAGRAVRLPPPKGLAVVMWIPAAETSTTSSRQQLPDVVPFDAAIHNVGRAALMVAALATGDHGALRDACADRLHQEARLADAPASALALAAALTAGALAAWVSGSGPSVAMLAHANAATKLAGALPDTGHTKVLPVAQFGVRVS